MTATSAVAAAPRGLWEQVSSLGGVTGGLAPGPLSQLLTQAAQVELRDLLRQLATQGLGFGHAIDEDLDNRASRSQGPRRPLSPEQVADLMLAGKGDDLQLAVTAPDMAYGEVRSLDDVRTLQRFYVRGVQAAHERTAAALEQLAARGQRFPVSRMEVYKGGSSCSYGYEGGRYGAYKTLVEGSGNVKIAQSGADSGRTVVNEEHLCGFAWFKHEGDRSLLAHPQTAEALKTLDEAGYHFFNDTRRLAPEDAYALLTMPTPQPVRIGAGGVPVSDSRLADQLGEATLPADVRRARDVVARDGAVWTAQKVLDGYEIATLLQAAVQPFEETTFDERWDLVKGLVALDQACGGKVDAHGVAAAMEALRTVPRAGIVGHSFSREELVTEYQGLRERLQPRVAVQVLTTLHGALPSELLDADEYAEARETLVSLTEAGGTLEAAWAGREVLRLPLPAAAWTDETPPRAVLAGLFTFESAMPETSGGVHNGTAAQRAIEDYKLCLSWLNPGETVSETAARLRVVAGAVVPKDGWARSRDHFQTIQSGLRKNRFHGRTAEEAQRELVTALVHGQDVSAVIERLLKAPSEASQPQVIEKSTTRVRIGGIEVPVRVD